MRRRPAPGQAGLVMLGLAVGILLMSVQLWLLTLAFNLYFLGDRHGTLIAAIVSGAIFLGGLAMLRVLRRSARRQAPPDDARGHSATVAEKSAPSHRRAAGQ